MAGRKKSAKNLLKESIARVFERKGAKVVEANLLAFDLGMSSCL